MLFLAGEGPMTLPSHFRFLSKLLTPDMITLSSNSKEMLEIRSLRHSSTRLIEMKRLNYRETCLSTMSKKNEADPVSAMT